MSIIHHHDKRSGLTYVYESKSYWDKEKKQPRSHRKLIGRWDSKARKIVQTAGWGKRRNQNKQVGGNTKRLFFGATYLFDQIGEIVGITADLKKCFPKFYKQILSIAYYLILEDRNTLSRFQKWSLIHHHPYGKDIASQGSSKLFGLITKEAKMKFFRLQRKRRLEHKYWIYDIASISSCSKILKQVQCVKNGDGESLPQINLALLFGHESQLPFYYRKLSRSISDIKTAQKLLGELDNLGFSDINLFLTPDFYSKENIENLYKRHLKFLIEASAELPSVQPFIHEVSNRKDSSETYNKDYKLYVFTKTFRWDCKEDSSYKKATNSEKRLLYLHLYYYKLDKTPLVLISNDIEDSICALELYRSRKIVGRTYFDIKDRLNTRLTSDSALEGKYFVEFVALIYLSYIKQKMQESGLFREYTLQSLLDKLDCIECFINPDEALIQSVVLPGHKQLYRKLGVKPLPAKFLT